MKSSLNTTPDLDLHCLSHLAYIYCSAETCSALFSVSMVSHVYTVFRVENYQKSGQNMMTDLDLHYLPHTVNILKSGLEHIYRSRSILSAHMYNKLMV